MSTTQATVTFQDWANLVHSRYNELVRTHDELYTVDCPDIFEKYLSFFPEGSNPIFRVRTEHDCSTCKQFIRNLGCVVGIGEAKKLDGSIITVIETVWDNFDDMPEESPQSEVSFQMMRLIESSPITGVFRSKERRYGVASNFDAEGHQYHHFHGEVTGKYRTDKPDAERGEAAARFQVFKRGLDEFQISDLANIIETIEGDETAIYRGSEHLAAIKGFKTAMVEYYQANRSDLWVWRNINNRAAVFRNTAIGSLFVDLAKGVDLEVAVKLFEAKVAPQNYKRTSSLITPRMIEGAMHTIEGLGLRDALDRRVARIEDVSVNDVIWANRSTKSKMRDSLVDALMESAPGGAVGDMKNVQDVSVEDFFAKILPTAKDVKVLIENKHLGNFVTLTAPVHDDTGASRLFKWNNDFAWSYDGDLADSSMKTAVVAAGGRVDGVLRFTHQWNHVGRNASLMDLHVFLPGCQHKDGCHNMYPFGPRVGWNSRKDQGSKGVQDVDYVQPAPDGFVPVENITFPDGRLLPNGVYTFAIHNWQRRNPTTSGFRAEIEYDGNLYQYDHPEPLANKQWITLAKLHRENGQFTKIEHIHPVGSPSRDKWGIKTEAFAEVETIMLSPNHWEDGGGVGNKHYIFALKGCANPEPVRGIYNEFLRRELESHRKVFEILGAKTKALPDQTGLSGVGFSSTKKADIVAVVDRRPYRIQF